MRRGYRVSGIAFTCGLESSDSERILPRRPDNIDEFDVLVSAITVGVPRELCDAIPAAETDSFSLKFSSFVGNLGEFQL